MLFAAKFRNCTLPNFFKMIFETFEQGSVPKFRNEVRNFNSPRKRKKLISQNLSDEFPLTSDVILTVPTAFNPENYVRKARLEIVLFRCLSKHIYVKQSHLETSLESRLESSPESRQESSQEEMQVMKNSAWLFSIQF